MQAIGLAYVFAVAYWLGRRESRRLGLAGRLEQAPASRRELTEAERALRRPRLFWINLALTVVLMGAMVAGTLEPVVGFMAGVALRWSSTIPARPSSAPGSTRTRRRHS